MGILRPSAQSTALSAECRHYSISSPAPIDRRIHLTDGWWRRERNWNPTFSSCAHRQNASTAGILLGHYASWRVPRKPPAAGPRFESHYLRLNHKFQRSVNHHPNQAPGLQVVRPTRVVTMEWW